MRKTKRGNSKLLKIVDNSEINLELKAKKKRKINCIKFLTINAKSLLEVK
jgi:hypothetical protein